MFNINDYKLELGGYDGKYFTRNKYINIDDNKTFNEEYKKHIEKYHNEDVYKSIYMYEKNKDIESCKLYGPLYFDLDGDIEYSYIALRNHVGTIVNVMINNFKLKDNEIQIYFSGSKGFHIIIPGQVLGVEPANNLNMLYKSWAEYFVNTYKVDTIDLKIYDRKRLFRLPGSINKKTGLYKIPVTINELYNSSLDELKKMAKTSREFPYSYEINPQAAILFYYKSQNFYKKPNKNNSQLSEKSMIPETKQELLPCVKELLTTGAEKGNRNNTLVLLSSAVMQAGYLLDETIELMESWNNYNEPPLDNRELTNTVRSAYSMLLSGKGYGCNSFKELGYCHKDCKLMEKEDK